MVRLGLIPAPFSHGQNGIHQYALHQSDLALYIMLYVHFMVIKSPFLRSIHFMESTHTHIYIYIYQQFSACLKVVSLCIKSTNMTMGQAIVMCLTRLFQVLKSWSCWGESAPSHPFRAWFSSISAGHDFPCLSLDNPNPSGSVLDVYIIVYIYIYVCMYSMYVYG